MPRATNNPASRKRRKRVLKQAKDFRGGRSKLIRTATESVKRGMAFSYRDRRTKKRNMRSLWILRIGAACNENNISYSRFMQGLKAANVDLNRKIISDLAVHDKDGFSKLTEIAKSKVA